MVHYSLLPYQYRNEINVISIFSVLLSIRTLLNNEPFAFANLILDLFADVLNQLKSDVCGLTDIHKSTYIGDQPHCGDLAPHTPTLLSTSQCCYNFSIVTGWITHYECINKDNT